MNCWKLNSTSRTSVSCVPTFERLEKSKRHYAAAAALKEQFGMKSSPVSLAAVPRSKFDLKSYWFHFSRGALATGKSATPNEALKASLCYLTAKTPKILKSKECVPRSWSCGKFKKILGNQRLPLNADEERYKPSIFLQQFLWQKLWCYHTNTGVGVLSQVFEIP